MIRYTDDLMDNILGVKNIPNFLFHYTKLDTLESILKFKTIRFTRLDLVNDPDESIDNYIEKSSKFIFASCWTDTIESIPMWNMYGDNFEGIIIKAPVNLFSGRNKPTVWEKGGATIMLDRFIEIGQNNTLSISGPNKIYYTSHYKSSSVNEIGKDYYSLLPYDLGLIKNEIWSYESEWRFHISALSGIIGDIDDINMQIQNHNDFFDKSIEYVDIPVDNFSFFEFEIITGKNFTSKNREKLKQILKDNNLDIPIIESSIRINLKKS